MGETKAEPIVAMTLDAVPGWHAAIAVRTALSDADLPTGVTYARFLVLPIRKRGLECPAELLMRRAGPTDPFGGLLAAMYPGIMGPSGPQFRPLDPRSKGPTFLQASELRGVYPPSCGNARAVLGLVMAEAAEQVERARERDERMNPKKEASDG